MASYVADRHRQQADSRVVAVVRLRRVKRWWVWLEGMHFRARTPIEPAMKKPTAVSAHVDDNVLFAAPAQSMRRPACLAQLAWQRFKRGEVDDLAMLSPIYIHTSHT